MPNLYYLPGTARNTTRVILEGLPFEEIRTKQRRLDLAIQLAGLGRNDIVLTDSLGYSTFILALLKLLKGYRTIIRLRGDYFVALELLQSNSIKSRFKQRIMKHILKNSDLVVFNSHHVRKQEAYAFLEGKAEVVHNPLMMNFTSIDLDQLEQKRALSHRLKILSVTNFYYHDKVRPLADALEGWISDEFLQKNNIEWSIVGDGPLLDSFQEQFGGVASGGHISFHGFCQDVSAFYRSHHLFAHMSGFDSFPNVILEASVHGMPVITTPASGGTLEAMCDKETGHIVSDGQSFRRVILDYLDFPKLRRQHGRKGREFILNNFTIKHQREKMEAVLKKHFADW